MPIRVLIVDDEPLARDELAYLLSQHPGVEVVGEAEDGQTALALARTLQPDVVFLDINLGDTNGLEVARQFLTLRPPPRVVFATAYDQYALQAFEVKALDYIVKPFTRDRVAETVARLREMPLRFGEIRSEDLASPERLPAGRPPAGRLPASPPGFDRLAVETGERIVLIPPEAIVFATREERCTVIKTADGQVHRTRMSLQELEERLQHHPFFRPHRAYLVNVGRIAEIHPWFNGAYELVMADRERTRIPVSRGSARRLRELLGF